MMGEPDPRIITCLGKKSQHVSEICAQEDRVEFMFSLREVAVIIVSGGVITVYVAHSPNYTSSHIAEREQQLAIIIQICHSG